MLQTTFPAVEQAPRELVIGTRAEFKAKLLVHFAEGRDVIVDLADTAYMDSSALGMLITTMKAAKAAGRQLLIANLNADLKLLFELTKLDVYFQTSDTVPDAQRRLTPA